MAGRQSDIDHSTIPPQSAGAGAPDSAVLSYDSYLRVKSGISDSVLRMAGLPSAKDLSYEAYVAALGGKAQPTQRPPDPVRAEAPRAEAPRTQVLRAQVLRARALRARALRKKAKQRISAALTRSSGVVRELVRGKRNVLIISGTAAALLLVFFIGTAIDSHISGGNDAGAAEANASPVNASPVNASPVNASPVQATYDPIALAVTQADALLPGPVATDLELGTPLPTIPVPTVTPLMDQPAQPMEIAEVSPPTASKTLSKSTEAKSTEGRTKKTATTASKTATAKITEPSTKQVAANTTKKKSAIKAPKPVQTQAAQTKVAADGTPPPLRWLGQVFEDLSESLGGSKSSTDGAARRKAPSVGDRESKR